MMKIFINHFNDLFYFILSDLEQMGCYETTTKFEKKKKIDTKFKISFLLFRSWSNIFEKTKLDVNESIRYDV